MALSFREKSVFEAGAGDASKLVQREAHIQGGGIFVYERGVEHGGIVSGESDGNAMAEEFGKRVLRERGIGGVELDVESVGAEVAGRADFEGDVAFGEGVHEGGAANGGDAVANAFGVKYVNGVLDLLGAAGFSGVANEVEAVGGGKLVSGEEIGEREREFIAAEAQGDYAIGAEISGEAGNFYGGRGAKLADGIKDELHLRAAAGGMAARESFADGLKICGDVLFAEEHDSDREGDFGVEYVLCVESGGGVLG